MKKFQTPLTVEIRLHNAVPGQKPIIKPWPLHTTTFVLFFEISYHADPARWPAVPVSCVDKSYEN